MDFLCPKCNRVLLSRRNKECQYCGSDLPKELLLSEAEIKAESRQWEENQKKKRAVRRKADDEEEELRKSSENGSASDFML